MKTRNLSLLLLSFLIFGLTSCSNADKDVSQTLKQRSDQPVNPVKPIDIREHIADYTEQFTSSAFNPGISSFDNNIIELEDGWLVTGTEFYVGLEKPPAGFIAKFDKNGNKLWEQFLTSDTIFLRCFQSTIEIADGYLILAYGSHHDIVWHPQRDGGVVSIKYSKNGELTWVKELGIKHAVPTEAGFAGVSYLRETTGKNIALVEYSTNGEVLWQSNIGNSLVFAEYQGSIADTLSLDEIHLLPNDGGFLIEGAWYSYFDGNCSSLPCHNGGPGYYGSRYVLASVASDGSFRWQKNFNPGTEEELKWAEIIIANDGIIALGRRSARKYDFDLKLIKETPYRIDEDHYFNRSKSAASVAKAGENYFICGDYSDGHASAFVLGLNANGEIIWETGRHNETDMGTGITYHGTVKTENGFAVLAGYRHYGIPTTMGPHEIALHFLFYDLDTKTFTKSNSLF